MHAPLLTQKNGHYAKVIGNYLFHLHMHFNAQQRIKIEYTKLELIFCIGASLMYM